MWVKLDDHFPDHEKLAECEIFAPLCGWLYVCGLAYCNRQLTDGRIPKGHIHRLVSFRGLQYVRAGIGHGKDAMAEFTDDIDIDDLAKWLVAVGLWEEDEHGDYRVHDYLDYQPSRSDVIKARAEGTDRVAAWRKRRAERRNAVGNTVTNAVGNTVGNSVGSAVSTPCPDPGTDPDPEEQDLSAKISRTRASTTVPVIGTAVPVADLWDHWREVAERCGVLEPAILSPKGYAALRPLFDLHTLDTLRSAVTAFWTTPHFQAKRQIGMFAANAGQIVAHVASGATHPYGERPPMTRRAAEDAEAARLAAWAQREDA